MKKCFKCGEEKPLSEFYTHKQMSDGHLGKCKECTKIDVAKRYYDPESRQRIKEYERKRFRDPKRKEKIAEYQRKRRSKNKKDWARQVTRRKLKPQPCEICGAHKTEAHHEDYSKPLSVRWLCFRHHREAHGQLID